MAMIDENDKYNEWNKNGGKNTTGIINTQVYQTEGEQTFPDSYKWIKKYNEQETVNAWWKFIILVVMFLCVAGAFFEIGKELGVKGTHKVITSAAKNGNPIMFLDGTTFICNEIEKTTVVK